MTIVSVLFDLEVMNAVVSICSNRPYRSRYFDLSILGKYSCY